jgi:hypothetical protein
MTKCQDQTGGDTPRHMCITFDYDEEIVAQVNDGYRVRYVARDIEGIPDGPQKQELMAQMVTLDLLTDAGGDPIALQDRPALFQELRRVLPQGSASEQTIQMFERMDDATAARVFSKDFSPFSSFQGLTPQDVGVPFSQHISSPFPLLPSQMVAGTATFQVDGIDHGANVAHAHFEYSYDADSMASAVRALMASVAPNVAQGAADMRVQLSRRVDGEVDLASGATTHVRSVQTADVIQGGQTMHRVDTEELTRCLHPG